MEVMGGFRMNDNHTDSVRQGVGAGARFIDDNPRFRLRDAPPGPTYRLSEPLDFSFSEVRAYLLSVISRFVELFAVDGVELCFRDNRYFPPGCGPEREHLMTELVRQVRALLDRTGAGRRLLLGCRVPSTIAECHVMGLERPHLGRRRAGGSRGAAGHHVCRGQHPLRGVARAHGRESVPPLPGVDELGQPPCAQTHRAAADHPGPAPRPGHQHVRPGRRRHLPVQPLPGDDLVRRRRRRLDLTRRRRPRAFLSVRAARHGRPAAPRSWR